uniref:RGS domain-containing protein n=1 Tax=Mesocestoides corti TaxID=53468 RepID=A0A5K3FTD9_MESCO
MLLVPALGNLGFQFRAKTVDHFVDLKESILLSYPQLEAPPVRSIQDFLMSASSLTMNPKPDRDVIEAYCILYNRARYDPSPYTESDYFRFLEIHHQLLESVVAKELLLSSESPNRTTKGLYKRRKTPYFKDMPKPMRSVNPNFLEMEAISQAAKNAPKEIAPSGGAGSTLRSPLSRSGSAASDDSQTALIGLDDSRNDSGRVGQ